MGSQSNTVNKIRIFTPAMLRNAEHSARVHPVAFSRTLGALAVYISSASWLIVLEINHHSVLKIALFILITAILAMFGLMAKIMLLPCKCGKVSLPSREQHDNLLSRKFGNRKQRHLMFWQILWPLLLALPLFPLLPYAMSISISAANFLLSCYCVILGIYGTVSGLSLILGINQKRLQSYLENCRFLSEDNFGKETLVDKSPDELNELIDCALKNGRTDQAEMISQYLLIKVDKLTEL